MADILKEPTSTQLAAAKSRGTKRLSGPRAETAHYDAERHRIVIGLTTGIEISFSPSHAQGLEDAQPSTLQIIEITPAGLGLHFPKLDADIYVPALVEGLLGSEKWMASRMGARGGSASSVRKADAARANGALGGRPKKKVA
jgi:Protein of unknown function (DUF2442)